MTMNDLIRRKLTVEMSRQIPVSIPMMRDKQWYILGDLPPHYPVPSTFGQVFITSMNVYRANPQGYDSETYL